MVGRGAGVFLFLTGGVLVPIGAVVYALPGAYASAGLYLLVIGLVLLAIAMITSLRVILPARPGRIVDLLESILYSALMGLALAAAYRIVAGHPLRRDLTQDKTYTLSPQTLELMAKLPAPVQATALLKANDPRLPRLRALLVEYAQASPLFSARILDPQERPSEVNRLGVAGISCVVLESGTRAVRVRTFEEAHLTGGVIRLTRPALSIGFVTGQKERELRATARDQLAGVLDTLDLENIQPEHVTLAALPTGLKALVMCGPKSDVTPDESKALDGFLAGGGGVLLALDLAVDPQPNLLAFLDRHGLQSPLALTLDMNLHAKNDAGTLLIDDLPSHAITRGVAGLLLPGVRPVAPRDPPLKDVEMETLAKTSDKSWAEMDAPHDFSYTEGRDIRGPVPLAQAVTLKAGRLLVIGNSLFMSDLALPARGNRDFLVNALAWVSDTGDLPGIVPDSHALRMMVMESDELGVMVAVTCFGMPLVTFLVGLFGWLYRR